MDGFLQEVAHELLLRTTIHSAMLHTKLGSSQQLALLIKATHHYK